MSDDEEQTSGASHVAVRPPSFELNRAKLYFVLLESQFTLSRVTNSATKFHHVISHLPLDILDRLPSDVISAQDYDTIKAALLELNTKSNPEAFDDMMTKFNYLSTKPTMYLHELSKLASQLNVSEDFIKIKFLKAMPDDIRNILVTYNTDSLHELARVADTLLAYNTKHSNVASIKTNSYAHSHSQKPPFQSSSNFRQSSYSQQPTHSQQPTSVNYNNPSIPNGIRAFNANQRPKICRAHIYFGADARSCRAWCMLAKSSTNIQPDSRPSSRSSSPAPQPSGNQFRNP